MNISVLGCGYVGLVTAAGFSSKGHEVVCFDIDPKKVDMINSGAAPIYEHGLEPILKSSIAEKRLRATKSMDDAMDKAQVTFICVGTPSKDDGSMDLKYVRAASESVGRALAKKPEYHLVVLKSTVVPGTTEDMIRVIESSSGKRSGHDFGVCMSPEFLREGEALDDFFDPDRVVIGEYDKKSGDMLETLFSEFKAPIFRTSQLRVAEMIKYASNAFLALKVSFANEVGNICKEMNVDVYDVMHGVGMDKRISPHFLRAGCGFGGSCFGKDVNALVSASRKHGYEPKLLKAVIALNEAQPKRMMDLLKKHTPLKGAKVCVLGVAFKPGTDDIRDAPALKIIECLIKGGAKVTVYDPEAINNAKNVLGSKVAYAKSATEGVSSSDYVIIATEWDEFRNKKLYAGKVVIDGRHVDEARAAKVYEGICW